LGRVISSVSNFTPGTTAYVFISASAMNIGDYFSSIERSLEQSRSKTSIEIIEVLASDDFNGILRCRVYFWDESFLSIHETVSTELGYPVRIVYAYSYIRDDQCVFRYDNAPHHPDIVTFPHHKHIGEDKIAPTDQPTVNQVLGEIEKYLKE